MASGDDVAAGAGLAAGAACVGTIQHRMRQYVTCHGAPFKHILCSLGNEVTILSSDSTSMLNLVKTREAGPPESHLIFRAIYLLLVS